MNKCQVGCAREIKFSHAVDLTPIQAHRFQKKK
jgi:hypothetical protein